MRRMLPRDGMRRCAVHAIIYAMGSNIIRNVIHACQTTRSSRRGPSGSICLPCNSRWLTCDLHWAHLSRTYGIDQLGHGALPSFMAGVMKPHADIYLQAEQRFSLIPDETVFIDDRADNIAAAQSRGWHGIVHRGYDTTYAALRSLAVRDSARYCA